MISSIKFHSILINVGGTIPEFVCTLSHLVIYTPRHTDTPLLSTTPTPPHIYSHLQESESESGSESESESLYPMHISPVLQKKQNPGSHNGPPMIDGWMVRLSSGWSVNNKMRP